jgi:hypothetical protein
MGVQSVTAWAILTASSSLPAGTAWQHLNAQQGGGPVTLVLYGETTADIMADISAALESTDVQANIEEPDYEVALEPDIGSDIE